MLQTGMGSHHQMDGSGGGGTAVMEGVPYNDVLQEKT
ncbi:MAG: hypothetical protein BWX92_03320 [Deltaproteobacteria bacterium ADurb.Bin135]|nr:MAG: hypothetical protein BWX92_03320 [Deltaproteobacteria bacterium ADurb.Bin135]